MDSKNEERDDPEYQRVFTALDELKLASLKPFFKEQCLQDDALFFMESEEELRNFLVKELKLPFGHGFKFSRHWFHSYHKAEGTLDSRLQACNLPQVTVTHSEKDLGKNERTFRSSGSSGTLKNDPSATTRPSISDVEVIEECKGLMNFTKSTTQRQLEKDEGINVARGPENVMIRPPEKPMKEPEFLQVSNGNPNLKFQNQQKSQELSSQVKTCVVEGNFQVEIANANHNMAADDISCKNNRKSSINLEKQQDFQTDLPSLITPSGDDEHHAASDVGNETSRTGFVGCDAGGVPMTSRYSENETSDSKVEDCEGILMNEYQEETAGGRNPSTSGQGLERIDSDPSTQTGELKHDGEQTRTISDGVENQINLDVNNNSSIAIDFCDMKVCANNDSTAAKEGRTGKEVSGDNGDESGSTFAADAGILIEVSSQRNKPGEGSYSPEKDNHSDISQVTHKCMPRTLGVKGKEVTYEKGFVLDAEENREVEFKSLASANPSLLPWKIMEKAKKFICACLNADSKGIIYYGVGDSQEQCSKFKRGEIVGLDVEDIIDDIMKAFQFVLDDHIKSDAGPLQKGGEQNCVNLEFVPVTSEGNRTSLYVIEIEITRDWKFCKDNIYYSKCWTEKRGVKMEKDPSTKKALNDLYKVQKDQFDDVAIRTSGASTSVKQHEVNRQVKEPLMAKYKEWKRKEKIGTNEAPEDSIPDDADVKRFSALKKQNDLFLKRNI